MASASGPIRVARAVFEQIDRVLRDERGPNGEPSRNDFLSVDFLRVVDAFAEEFSSLSEAVPGRSDYRLLITSGMLVPGIAVIGQRLGDGSIELLWIGLDTDAPWE